MSIALIISCEYSKFPAYRLYGCFNDAERIITRFKKIDPNINIIFMRDDLDYSNPLFPDKKNIIRQLLNLSTSGKPLLFFHYSGHGTQIRDTNNDESRILQGPSGFSVAQLNGLSGDSCIVCYNNKQLDVLVDDDIYSCLVQLKPNQVLYGFADSCNSGTLFDLCYLKVGRITKPFTTDNLSVLSKQLNNCTMVSSYYPTKVNKTLANVIFVSGSRDKQYSYELTDASGSYGLFTYNLCRVLDFGVQFLSFKQFYYLLIAAMNLSEQVPVLSFSRNFDIDKNMMSTFQYKVIYTGPNTVTNVRLLPLLNRSTPK